MVQTSVAMSLGGGLELILLETAPSRSIKCWQNGLVWAPRIKGHRIMNMSTGNLGV